MGINDQTNKFIHPNQPIPMTYSKLFSFALLLTVFALFSACQEEEDAALLERSNFEITKIDPAFSPELPSIGNGSVIAEANWLRYPMPCPLPRKTFLVAYRGGKQCEPGILDLGLHEGFRILDVQVELFTHDGQRYASSGREYGGGFEAGGERARISVAIVDSQLAEPSLIQITQVAYLDHFGEKRTETVKEEFTFEQ